MAEFIEVRKISDGDPLTAETLNAPIDDFEVNQNIMKNAVDGFKIDVDAINAAVMPGGYVGSWEDQTGAATQPYSVHHNGTFWSLTNDLVDVTVSEPSGTNPDWIEDGIDLGSKLISDTPSDDTTYSSNLIDSKLNEKASNTSLSTLLAGKLSRVNPSIEIGGLTEVDNPLNGTLLSASNGGIQYINVTSNRTLTTDLTNGQSVFLLIDGANNYVLTLPSPIIWLTSKGNVAPSLTGTKDALVIWRQRGLLFAAVVGNGVV